MTLQKIDLRVALVDRTGNILYHGVADDRTDLPGGGEPGSASKGEGAHVAVDLFPLYGALDRFALDEAPRVPESLLSAE